MDTLIIQANNPSHRDIINNNPKLKSSFESIYNLWNEFVIQTEGKMRIRHPSVIEKYKDSLENINGKYFSKTPIYYTSYELFEMFNEQFFSLYIINDEVSAIAIGSIWPEIYYISHVRSNVKGGCTKVISKLLDFYWDNNMLQFKTIPNMNDPNVMLHVLEHNIPAVKCYSKFGFTMTDEILKDNRVMILTKESYAENYLIPKLNEILKHKNK